MHLSRMRDNRRQMCETTVDIVIRTSDCSANGTICVSFDIVRSCKKPSFIIVVTYHNDLWKVELCVLSDCAKDILQFGGDWDQLIHGHQSIQRPFQTMVKTTRLWRRLRRGIPSIVSWNERRKTVGLSAGSRRDIKIFPRLHRLALLWMLCGYLFMALLLPVVVLFHEKCLTVVRAVGRCSVVYDY
jgi:hypothetical protein